MEDSGTNSSSTDNRSKAPISRGIYVPRGRREINEKNAAKEEEQRKLREAERAQRKAEDEERLSVLERRRKAFLDDDSPSSRSEMTKLDSSGRRRDGDSSPTPSSSSRVVDDAEFRDFIDNEKLASCCIVFDTFTSEMSDRAKDVEIKPYIDLGGLHHWFGPRVCVIVFMNETLARRSLNQASRSIHKPVSLAGTTHCTGACLSVIRDLHASLKPERDSRVANRLIGAALGVRVPKRSQPPKKEVVVEPERDIPDAWDD